jgi:hypothetical protein
LTLVVLGLVGFALIWLLLVVFLWVLALRGWVLLQTMFWLNPAMRILSLSLVTTMILNIVVLLPSLL